MKLKKDDTVEIQRGKDKGKTGKVLSVLPKDGKVLIEGINQYKRHVKAKAQNQKSEIVTITKPLPISNVALLCPKCKKITRVGYKMVSSEKVRICKKCGQAL